MTENNQFNLNRNARRFPRKGETWAQFAFMEGHRRAFPKTIVEGAAVPKRDYVEAIRTILTKTPWSDARQVAEALGIDAGNARHILRAQIRNRHVVSRTIQGSKGAGFTKKYEFAVAAHG